MSNYPTDTKKAPRFDSGAWIKWLHSAFLPKASENADPNRFDNILAQGHLHTCHDRTLRVLDLGAGDCLFLSKLIEDHKKKGQCIPQLKNMAKLQYNAVERHLSEQDQLWQKMIAECKGLACCFTRPKLWPIDITSENGRLLQKTLGKSRFDLILLSNIIHELPPTHLKPIFSILGGCLKEQGELFLLDPDADWCWSPTAWETPENSLVPKIEWEAGAIWLSSQQVIELLKAVGFRDVEPLEAPRSKMDLWKIVAKSFCRAEGAETETKRILIQTIDNRTSQILAKCKDHRNLVAKSLSSHDGDQRILALRLVEFFTACASHAKHSEAHKELL